MGEEKKGIDRGVLYVLTALVYLAVAGILLSNVDWNPHTQNYAQYLVNTSGAYISGVPYNDGYALLARADSNTATLVFTDSFGEVKDAYILSPLPSSVMVWKDSLFFLFAEGNRLEVVAYDGSFVPLYSASLSWDLRPLPYPRFVNGPYALALADRADIEARGILYVSIEKNVLDPALRVYFCRNCSFSPLYSLPDGSLVAAFGRTPYLIIPTKGGVSSSELRSNPAVVPTDVCDDLSVGIDAHRRLIWGKLGADRFYEANIEVDAYPVCREGVVYFTSNGVLSAVAISPELNEVIAYFSSASNFTPFAVFDDLPYFVLVGSDSGNPEFVRNVVPGFKCPDSLYMVDENVSVAMIPLSVSQTDVLKWTTPDESNAESFVSIQRVSIDEDFRCYKP